MPIVIIQGAEDKLASVHYEINTDIPPLGVGGMGQVMRGVRVNKLTGTREDVAVKFLYSDLSPDLIDRARREASIRIDHENLIKMYGFIEVNHRYHVVSELLRGVILTDLLRGKTMGTDGKPCEVAGEMYCLYKQNPVLFAVEIVKSLLSGLMTLHDRGYIHRDIDPSNIMVTADRKVKLIDFGVAKRLSSLTTHDRQLTSAGQFVGKAAYAAPELVLGDVAHQNESTDIYAVGVLLFELIVGHLPFTGAMSEVMEKQLRSKMPLKEVSNKLARRIIEKATAKKQSERFASAAEFRVAIEKLGRSLTQRQTRPNGGSLGIPALVGKVAVAFGVILSIIGIALGIRHYSTSGQTADSLDDVETVIQEEETANTILDSTNPDYSSIDPISGAELHSAAWYTHHSLELLKNPQTAQEGVETLKKVVETGYSSSAMAGALLAFLYSHEDKGNNSYLYKWLSIVSPLGNDYSKAHQYAMEACQLDSHCYPALFIIGLDYYYPSRGFVNKPEPDVSLDYLGRSWKEAKQQGDEAFERLVSSMIDTTNL